jgi:hypothetical protein
MGFRQSCIDVAAGFEGRRERAHAAAEGLSDPPLDSRESEIFRQTDAQRSQVDRLRTGKVRPIRTAKRVARVVPGDH